MEKSVEIISQSSEHTFRLGKQLSKRIRAGDILAFCGELGAGKTCFIQGICRGLGVPETRYVTSPSFVILNIYKGRLPIYHIDFYRITHKDEILDLGYEEFFFSEGVCLIEWAERAMDLLPDEYLKITIEAISPNVRKIKISFHGDDYVSRFSDIG